MELWVKGHRLLRFGCHLRAQRFKKQVCAFCVMHVLKHHRQPTLKKMQHNSWVWFFWTQRCVENNSAFIDSA